MTTYERKLMFCPCCQTKTAHVVEDAILVCEECNTIFEEESDEII